MTLKYLLDTNIVSEPLRPRPNAGVMRKLQRHEQEIAIASVVWHELRFGVERLPQSRRRSLIEHYLEDVVLATIPIFDYDRSAAEWHAASERVSSHAERHHRLPTAKSRPSLTCAI